MKSNISNKCESCSRYNKQDKCFRNKLYCFLFCEEYGKYQFDTIKKILKEEFENE